MYTRESVPLVLAAAVLVPVIAASGQIPMGTAFTYQGSLEYNGSAVTDTCDFEFTLWDSLTGGSQQGPSELENGVTVDDGLFTVELDFGQQFDGNARWLELAVCCPSTCAPATLIPRQELTPAPYGLYAADADMVDGYNVSDLDARYVEENEPSSISSGMMQPNSVGTSSIQSDAVTTGELADDAVTVEKLAHNIDATGIGFDAEMLEGHRVSDLDVLYVEHNESNSISSIMIQPNAVTTGELASDAVTVEKLAHNIAATTIGFDAEKLGGNRVSDLDLRYVEESEADSVSSGMLQSDSVTTPKILAGAVTTDELADDAVTVDELAHNIDATGIGFNADKLDSSHGCALVKMTGYDEEGFFETLSTATHCGGFPKGCTIRLISTQSSSGSSTADNGGAFGIYNQNWYGTGYGGWRVVAMTSASVSVYTAAGRNGDTTSTTIMSAGSCTLMDDISTRDDINTWVIHDSSLDYSCYVYVCD